MSGGSRLSEAASALPSPGPATLQGTHGRGTTQKKKRISFKIVFLFYRLMYFSPPQCVCIYKGSSITSAYPNTLVVALPPLPPLCNISSCISLWCLVNLGCMLQYNKQLALRLRPVRQSVGTPHPPLYLTPPPLKLNYNLTRRLTYAITQQLNAPQSYFLLSSAWRFHRDLNPDHWIHF